MKQKQTIEDLEIYTSAVAHGCKPVWCEGMMGWAWHCGCQDTRNEWMATHDGDSQCSAITESSARNTVLAQARRMVSPYRSLEDILERAGTTLERELNREKRNSNTIVN